jgi:glycosyltransferase involved in cell wall biosynthesis
MEPTKEHTPESPRVLIVTATDRRRGAEVFTVRLGEGLSARGWEVETVSLTRSGHERRVDVEPLTDVSSARPGRFKRRIARALRARIRRYSPDVVLANGGATLRYGAFATLRTKAPLVYIAIGEPEYWLRSTLSRAANRWMLGRATMILAVSEATRAQLVVLKPSLADRTHVSYTGVPDALFEVRGEPFDGSLHVVMVGSLSDEKDPLLAVRAVAQVPGIRLRLVGGGPLEAQLRREVEALGVGDRVEMTGVVEDVIPHLEWANVLLLTSRTEGLPGAVLEAGAASVPAVAVDVGGVREAVGDGVSGFVVDRDGGIDAISAALSKLAADPELVRRMGRAARLHIKERFAMDPIIAGYAARLTEVLR